MKVVFLDFDGVLTTKTTKFGYGDPKCVMALNRLTSLTGAKIVVSSTWRMQGLEECQNGLKVWGVVGEVIDLTPMLQNLDATRGAEIKQWLVEHPDVKQFVILDDDIDMDDLRVHLFRCDTNLGLTDLVADIAIRRLL